MHIVVQVVMVLAVASAVDANSLRSSKQKSSTVATASTNEDWTIGPTGKNWCKASFLNKNPVAVCKYMKENGPKCTGCEPCIEKPIATFITQPPVVSTPAASTKCQNWCQASLNLKNINHLSSPYNNAHSLCEVTNVYIMSCVHLLTRVQEMVDDITGI